MKKFTSVAKKVYLFHTLTLCSAAAADTPLGLLGGEDFSGSQPAVAFTVTPAGVARAVTGGPLPSLATSEALRLAHRARAS